MVIAHSLTNTCSYSVFIQMAWVKGRERGEVKQENGEERGGLR